MIMAQNENNKCILLVRVSTQKQNFDAQEQELYNLAVADGYKDNNIIPICEKESGIKLSEEERNGLNRLKEEVEKGGITCVYAWEISRIARKKKVIFSIVDFLQVRGIQLIIKEPYIKLLNADGSINEAAETILTLFAQLSESEMRNKQARWKRTKEKYAQEGKYSGGKTHKYGYFIDDNGYYQINEEEASVVRWLYDTYINTNIGQYGLQKELEERGVSLRRGLIKRILNTKTYTGEETQIYGYQNGEKIPYHKRRYPQIITLETFEKAAEKRLTNNSNVDKSPNYFFGAKLIKCPVCGHNFVAVKAEKRYICWSYYGKDKDYTKCENNFQLDIIGLDSLLWYDAKGEYINYLINLRNGDLEKFKEQIEVIKQKIEACNATIAKSQPKKERVAEMYEEGVYSREQMKMKLAQIDEANEETAQRKITLEEELNRLNTLLNSTENVFAENYIEALATSDNIEDIKKMYDIVHNFISSVEASSAEILGKEVKKIVVNHLDGTASVYYMEKRKRIKQINFWMEPNEVIGVDIEELKKNGNYYINLNDEVKLVNRVVGRKGREF